MNSARRNRLCCVATSTARNPPPPAGLSPTSKVDPRRTPGRHAAPCLASTRTPHVCLTAACLDVLFLPQRMIERTQCWGLNALGALGLGDTLDRGDEPGEMGDALPAVSLGPGVTVAPDTGAAVPPTVAPTPAVSWHDDFEVLILDR